MIIESTPYSLQNRIRILKSKSQTIGFVPTMGALHQGHLSLIETALQKVDKLIVSIFINPTQFGPNEDYDKYPKNIEQDLLLLQSYPLDVVFTPTATDIYPFGTKQGVQIVEPYLGQLYCGVTRPHFFQGMLGVVLRLFNIVTPDFAFFGEKDYQQMTIVKKMVKDLILPIEIIGCPIIREQNGLAMSSRNQYLSNAEKEEAKMIYEALCFAKRVFEMEEVQSSVVLERVKHFIEDNSSIQIDYLAIVHPETLEQKSVISQHDRLLFAGYLGGTRLIDNIAF